MTYLNLKKIGYILTIVSIFTACSKSTSDRSLISTSSKVSKIDQGLSESDALSMTESSYVGGETGNGGGAVVCRNASTGVIEKVEVLDLYEARVTRNQTLGMGPTSLDFSQKIETVLNKLERLSPLRAAKYRALYKRFFNEAVIVPDANLTYIDDAAGIVVPVGCAKEQASILRNPEFPGDARYTISKILWDKMDNDSKAALILHEIIYQEGLSLGQTNSKPTRFLVGKLTSTQIDDLNPESTSDLLVAIGFKALDMFGTLVNKIDYPDDGTTTYANDKSYFFKDVARPEKITFKGITFGTTFSISVDKNKKIRSAYFAKNISRPQLTVRLQNNEDSFNLNFSEDEKLRSIEFRPSSVNQPNAPTDTAFSSSTDKPDRFMALYSGDLELEVYNSISLDADEKPFDWYGLIQVRNKKIAYVSGILYSTSESSNERQISLNGIIQKARLTINQAFQTPQGLKYFTAEPSYGSIYYIMFNAQGLLISGILSAGQPVVLQGGRQKTWLNPVRIKFNDDGTAVKIDENGIVAPDSDHIYDGCDIADFSPITAIIAKQLSYAISQNQIDWKPETLKVDRVANYIYSDAGYKHGLPTFAVSFETKTGALFGVETYTAESFGSESTGGVSLKEFAWLETQRGNEGQVISRYCKQDMKDDYGDAVYLVNKQTKFKIRLQQNPFAYQSIQENIPF